MITRSGIFLTPVVQRQEPLELDNDGALQPLSAAEIRTDRWFVGNLENGLTPTEDSQLPEVGDPYLELDGDGNIRPKLPAAGPGLGYLYMNTGELVLSFNGDTFIAQSP